MTILLPTLVLSLLGCGGGDPASLQDCGQDLACLEERVVAAWAEDPRGVRALLREQQDPLLQATLVEAVVEAHPGRADGLCETLPNGVTRTRCERIRERPHLWEIEPGNAASEARFSGEGSVVLAPSPTLREPRVERVRAVDCGPAVPENSCRARRSMEAAMTQDLLGASEICAGIGDVRWRGECFFDTVEQACTRQSPRNCGASVELCVAAGPYRTACLVQVAGELAATAPVAATEAGDAWSAIASQLQQARLRMGAIDPMLGERFVDRTWAESMLLAYGTARLVGGNPLDFTPEEARPHVRAAIAWRLAAQKDSGTLQQRAERVLEAEERRVRDAVVVPMQLGLVQVPSLWAVDLPGEAEIPWVAYLQDARRARADDAMVDARICVLEAAARMYPLDVDTLVEGLGDGEPVVRWTAARLLAAVRPGHVALGHVAQDPDPRVSARASGAGLGG